MNLATENEQTTCVDVLGSDELNVVNLTHDIDQYINCTNKPFKKDFRKLKHPFTGEFSGNCRACGVKGNHAGTCWFLRKL